MKTQKKLTKSDRVILRNQYFDLPEHRRLEWCIAKSFEYGMSYGRFVKALKI